MLLDPHCRENDTVFPALVQDTHFVKELVDTTYREGIGGNVGFV